MACETRKKHSASHKVQVLDQKRITKASGRDIKVQRLEDEHASAAHALASSKSGRGLRKEVQPTEEGKMVEEGLYHVQKMVRIKKQDVVTGVRRHLFPSTLLILTT